MRVQLSVGILLVVLMVNCNNRPKEETKVPATGHKKLVREFVAKPPSSFNDTLVIKMASAVFYKPDSVQLEKIKAVDPPMIFKSLQHDCFFQMRYAHTVLKKYYPAITILQTKNTRYLLFVKQDKSGSCIDLNRNNNICGLYIFNTRKDPEEVDMTNADTQLEFYFKK